MQVWSYWKPSNAKCSSSGDVHALRSCTFFLARARLLLHEHANELLLASDSMQVHRRCTLRLALMAVRRLSLLDVGLFHPGEFCWVS